MAMERCHSLHSTRVRHLNIDEVETGSSDDQFRHGVSFDVEDVVVQRFGSLPSPTKRISTWKTSHPY